MTSQNKDIILGIDPGTNLLGYGIIEINGSQPRLIAAGVVKLDKLKDSNEKYKRIFTQVTKLITMYEVKEMALEAPFFHKNVQSMLKLGRAQGISIAAAASLSIGITEYAPKKIKQSVTGNGNASKEQVAGLMEKILNFEFTGKYLDATDGLATALCHFYQRNALPSGKGKGGWAAFVKANPEKLKG